MTPETAISVIQRQLKDLGLYSGKIDAKWGPQSKAAFAKLIEGYGEDAAPVAEFDENTEQLIKELEGDEGCVLHAYPDSLGYLTIGIGRLIDKRKGGGITREEADYLKANDIRRIQRTLDQRYPEWRKLSLVRQRAFQNMAFQLGTAWPDEFKNTYSLIKSGKFQEAANALAKSLWAQQTPARAKRVIEMWRKG